MSGPRVALQCSLWLVPACLMLPVQQDALAEDVEPRATHISDSSTDRSPAKTTFPRYPRIARRDRIEGDATVCFTIDKRGHIHAARVENSTHRIFKRPALRAIRQSEFEPLAPDEVLAMGRTCRTFRFRLEPVFVANDE